MIPSLLKDAEHQTAFYLFSQSREMVLPGKYHGKKI
jgi:hypothetical protein